MDKHNIFLTEGFINLEDFKLCMINHKEKDTINRIIISIVYLIPSLTEKVLKKFDKFDEKEIEEINELKSKKHKKIK